ncbi:polysaccharide biosynthesis protein [Acidobacteria bacterium AH-259-A15]|nr:polysaccharide biosynthesis protein [Acidobacteria bacterium AH-259-A15]
MKKTRIGMSMSSNSKSLREIIRFILLVYVSLVGALTFRFLWMFFVDEVKSSSTYWNVVYYSELAFRNSLIPILVCGLVVFFVQNRFKDPLTPFGVIFRGFLSLTAFFGVIAFLGFIVGPDFTFPRETWIVAWGLSVVAFTSIVLTQRVDSQMKDRIVYSRASQFAIDSLVIGTTFVLAYLMRFDGLPPRHYVEEFLILAPYVTLFYLVLGYVWGMYSFLWRFTGLKEVLLIAQSVGSAALVILVLRILFFEPYAYLRIPFGVLVIHPMLVFVGLSGIRLIRRVQYAGNQNAKKVCDATDMQKKRVLLVGAGQAGLMLAQALEQRPEFEVVGFLDDDIRKLGRRIHGSKVLSTTQDLTAVVEDRHVDEVILSIPSAPKSVIRKIVATCEKVPIEVKTVPSAWEILLGKVTISQLRPVPMEDLLRRASVRYRADDVELVNTYQGTRILITGAGGSIGSELVRQLKEFQPLQLILLDNDENSLYEVSLEVRGDFEGKLCEIVADIRDLSRLERIFQRYKPQVVFHAAAYKHVPLMEAHPIEAILNNVVGSKNVIDLSIDTGAESFILISTDKAVNPTSVMGASKRVAEMIVQDRAARTSNTRLCGVRFGNVLGSRASVIPIFQKQIAQGKTVTVTHPEVRRYFMTIPEAVHLVIQSGFLGKRGEIFLLDMGDPVKIVELARQLIERSGLVPDEDIKIEFIGLRPGEKLYEELLVSSEDGVRSTKYPKVFVAKGGQNSIDQLDCLIQNLQEAARSGDTETIYRLLDSPGIGYKAKRSTHRGRNESLFKPS